MQLIFTTVIREVKAAWNSEKEKCTYENIINALYGIARDADGSQESVPDEKYASKINTGERGIHKAVRKKAFKDEVIERAPKYVKESLLKNLDEKALPMLQNTLYELAEKDYKDGYMDRLTYEGICEVKQLENIGLFLIRILFFVYREDTRANRKNNIPVYRNSCDDVNTFSAQASIGIDCDKDASLSSAQVEPPRKTLSVGGRANPPKDTAKAAELDIAQVIFENSKDILKKVTKNYDPNPDLCPELSGKIKKHTLIVSDGGAGKTTWMYKHWEELQKRYESNPDNAQIPIYIQLNAFDGSYTNNPTIGSFIKSRIAQQYAGLWQEDVASLLKQIDPNQYVLLLDALNEAKNSDALCAEIKELKDAGFHIILTSRRELNWEIREDFSVVSLARFSEEKINQVLRQKGFPEATGRLLTTLDRPMFLALYLGLGNDVKGLQRPGELFLAHHKWIKKMFSADKHGPAYQKQGDRLLGNVLPNLATQTNSIVFSDTDVAEIFNNLNCDSDEALAILCETGLIIDEGYDEYEGAHIYRWRHEFFLQFYQAMRIWQQMGYSTEKQAFQAVKNLPHELLHKDIDDHVLAFVGDVLETRFEGKGSIASPMSPIEKWLQDNCRSQSTVSKQHTDIEIQTCTANLIKVMILARNGHLEYSVFEDLDLQKTDFYDCWINGSSFCKAVLSDNTFFAPGHRYWPELIAYNHVCGEVASCSTVAGQIKLWDSNSGEYIRTIFCDALISSIAFSPDGQWLAVALLDNMASIQLHNLQTNEVKLFQARKDGTQHLDNINNRVVFSSDSRFVQLYTNRNGICLRWDINSGLEQQNLVLETAPCGKRIVVGSHYLLLTTENKLNLFDLDTGLLVRSCATPQAVDCAAINIEETHIVYKTGSTIYVHCLDGKNRNYSIPAIDPGITEIIVTQTAFAGINNQAHTVTVWNLSDGSLIKTLSQIDTISISATIPNSDIAICGAYNNHVYTINIREDRLCASFCGREYRWSTNVSFTKRNAVLFRRFEDGSCYLLDTSQKIPLLIKELSKRLRKERFSENQFFSFDGEYLFFTTASNGLEGWSIFDDCQIVSIKKEFKHISKVTFLENRETLVIEECDDLCISIWNGKTGSLISKLNGHSLWEETLTFAKNEEDTYLVSSGTDVVGGWEKSYLDYPEKISASSFLFQLPNAWTINKSVFLTLPFIKAVAAGFYNGRVCIWDIVSKEKLFDKTFIAEPVEQIISIPNSSHIAILFRNGVVSIADIYSSAELTRWNAYPEMSSDTSEIVRQFISDNGKDLLGKKHPVRLVPVSRDTTLIEYLIPIICLDTLMQHYDAVKLGEFSHFSTVKHISSDGRIIAVVDGFALHMYQGTELLWSSMLKGGFIGFVHNELSFDGKQYLSAFANGDVEITNIDSQQTLVWRMTDTLSDLTGCDFRNTSGFSNQTRVFLQMNGGIVS